MIRQDYILRLIEELRRTLAALVALKQEKRWRELGDTLDAQCQRLLGLDLAGAARLPETDLVARLLQGEATHCVSQKLDFFIALLKEAGDAATAQDRPVEARDCYLKALHLLIAAPGAAEPETRPDFVPQVDALRAGLADLPLPPRTLALLMRHYERIGAYAKAEDALFGLLEADADNPALREFGLAFYGRLDAASDPALAAGNLPRSEVEAGAAELRSRKPPPPRS